MLKLSLETPKNEAYFTIFNFFNFFFGGEAKRDFVRNKEKSRDVTSSADVDSSLVSTWFILHVCEYLVSIVVSRASEAKLQNILRSWKFTRKTATRP